MSRRPPVAHGLQDMWPYLAVVRCNDGDVDTFTRLAAEELRRQDEDLDDRVIQPPVWQWFRINPCGANCREHGWHIDEYHEGGPGRWRGSYVRLVARNEATKAAP